MHLISQSLRCFLFSSPPFIPFLSETPAWLRVPSLTSFLFPSLANCGISSPPPHLRVPRLSPLFPPPLHPPPPPSTTPPTSFSPSPLISSSSFPHPRPPPPPSLLITPLCTADMLSPLALQGAQGEDPGGMGTGPNILVTLYTAAEFCLETLKPVLQADSSTLSGLCRLEGPRRGQTGRLLH